MLIRKFWKYCAEADDGAGPADRGDDFVPTNDDPAPETPEPEAAAPETPADEPARDEKGRFTGKGVIPMDRHEAVLNKERGAREAAERRLAELEAERAAQAVSADVSKIESEIDELEKAYAKAMINGDDTKAAEVRAQVRAKERQIAQASTTATTQQTRDQIREEIRVETAIDNLKAKFPALDDAHESYDEALVDDVLAKQAWLIQTKRLTPSKALVEAATSIMARTAKPAADDPPPKGLDAAARGTERTAAAVKKALDTTKRQPADLSDVGLNSDKAGVQSGKVDASKMSYEEFSALPESTKQRLRGDMV